MIASVRLVLRINRPEIDDRVIQFGCRLIMHRRRMKREKEEVNGKREKRERERDLTVRKKRVVIIEDDVNTLPITSPPCS